jgi:hypothetical protein
LEVRRKKSWCVELAISERLYFYQYPFSFPKNFLICDQKYQLRVQFFFLKSFSISSLKKEFQIEKFFQTFSVSNSKTKDLRNYMIELFASLESSKRIEPGFAILLKTNQRKKVVKLTLKLISGAKSIFCTEMLPIGK